MTRTRVIEAFRSWTQVVSTPLRPEFDSTLSSASVVSSSAHEDARRAVGARGDCTAAVWLPSK